MHSGSSKASQVYIEHGLHGNEFCTSSAFALHGRHRTELAGPNRTTTGVLTAAAMCAGPLSLPTKILAAAITATSSPMDKLLKLASFCFVAASTLLSCERCSSVGAPV